MAQGYRLVELYSAVRISDKCTELKTEGEMLQLIAQNFPESGYCVAYLDYKVLLGTYAEKGLHFYDEEGITPHFVQRLRLFNVQREFLLWKTTDGFRWRNRIDDSSENGSPVEAVEAEQVLWGTKSAPLERGWTRLWEERGMELVVPLEDVRVNPEQRLKLITRNYIAYNPLGQAGYVDCRFVDFRWGGVEDVREQG